MSLNQGSWVLPYASLPGSEKIQLHFLSLADVIKWKCNVYFSLIGNTKGEIIELHERGHIA